jgi:hypothetical protein
MTGGCCKDSVNDRASRLKPASGRTHSCRTLWTRRLRIMLPTMEEPSSVQVSL